MKIKVLVLLIIMINNTWAVEDNFSYSLSVPSKQTPQELQEFTNNTCNMFESSLSEFNEYKNIWNKNILEIKKQNFWNHYYYDIDNALYRYKKNKQEIHIFWIKHIFQSLLNNQFYPRLKLLNTTSSYKDEENVFYENEKSELIEKSYIDRKKISDSFFQKVQDYYKIKF